MCGAPRQLTVKLGRGDGNGVLASEVTRPNPNPNPNANPSPNADASPRQVGMHLAPSLGRAVGHAQHHLFDGKHGGKHGGGAASESAL